MGAHESRKVDKDSAGGKSKGNPAVARDACGIGKMRGCKNQIFQHEINAQIGNHAADLRHRREKKPNECERPISPRKVQETTKGRFLFW